MSTEENKALVRHWFAETDRGNGDIIEQLCAPGYVDHSPPLPGIGNGSAAIRQANAALRAAFPTRCTPSKTRSPRVTEW